LFYSIKKKVIRVRSTHSQGFEWAAITSVSLLLYYYYSSCIDYGSQRPQNGKQTPALSITDQGGITMESQLC